MIEHLTFETFKEKVFDFENNEDWKYKGDVPCVIDFYADWCGPCKLVAPVLEELSKEYDGVIKIYKINTEEEIKLASVFKIRSIPSIIFVPMNGKPQLSVGALPKTVIQTTINDFLLK